MKLTLEAVVDSLEAAVAAEQAGADRLELCTALELGGLTPGIGLVQSVCEAVAIPVMVLIRPRSGGFRFSAGEHLAVCKEIESLLKTPVHGIVVGALDHSGLLHEVYMQEYKRLAVGMSVTCHRAFDRVEDQSAALERLIAWGYDRVLTSGGMPTAWEGRERLNALVSQAGNRILILAGSGVSAANARALHAETNCHEMHFSAIQRVKMDSLGVQVRMGAQDDASYQYFPDPEKVAAVRAALG